MPTIEMTARAVGVDLDASKRIAVMHYTMVDAETGEDLGCGGEVRISFDALDVIDARLGGRAPLTPPQRVDLLAKLVPSVCTARFVRTEIPPRAPGDEDKLVARLPLPPLEEPTLPSRQDVTVHAEGEIVDMRNRVPPFSKGA